jgi:hypothetical protein
MLSADVRFEGFTATDWTRTLSLFRPRVASGERDPERPQGGIVALAEGGRLEKLVHSQAGRLRLGDVAPDWPMGARALAERHNASWGLVLERGVLEDVMERFGARIARGDTLTDQTLLLVTLIQDELRSGRIEFWPQRVAGLPVPSASMVDRTLDAVCPRKHAIVMGLFDAGELWTAIAMRRGESGGFDWILGPDEIRRDVGLLAGDFRRDYRHLARAIERRMGKLSLGVFGEQATVRKLQVDPNPGAWARAVAVRDVILSPVPGALAIPLGLDAGRAVFSIFKSVAQRSELFAQAAPAVDWAREQIGESIRQLGVDDEGDPTRFEPLEIQRRLLSRDR